MSITLDGTTGITTPDLNTSSFTGPLSVSASAPTGSITVDASGRVTTPNQPAFYAYRSSGAGHISGTGNGVFDTTRFNRGNNYSTANGRFTAPVAGVYFFSGMGLPLSTMNSPFIMLFKNGSAYSASTYVINADESVSVSCAIELVAGDYVTVYFIDGSEQSYSQFSGFLIG